MHVAAKPSKVMERVDRWWVEGRVIVAMPVILSRVV